MLAQAGRIDILVNAAGAIWAAPAETYPEDGWNKVIAFNLTGLFELSAAVANAAFFPQGGGVIINLSSIEGLFAHSPDRPGTIAYNASKGAVITMTKSLAVEWGARNICVNSIAPGFFPTKMTNGLLTHHAEKLRAETPVGRLGGDEDLKGAAILLASEAGRHITGQTIVVDGGFTLT